MNFTHNSRRLEALAQVIARLEAELLDLERGALDVVGTEEDCVARETQCADTKAALTVP